MLKEAETKTIGFDDEIAQKFGSEVDICLGDNYNEVGKVNQKDIGIFKYDFTYFMNPDDVKKLPKEKQPEKFVAPKSFDFSKAERVIITKEELKRRELEQEKLKDL